MLMNPYNEKYPVADGTHSNKLEESFQHITVAVLIIIPKTNNNIIWANHLVK